MIEALESLQYKKNQDLTSVGVTVNGDSLPSYSVTQSDNRYVYTKLYTPQYLEGGVNYSVNNPNFSQIQAYRNLKVGYDPLDQEIDYLENVIYGALQSLDIPFFNYWYDIATVYAPYTVQGQVSSKDLYRPFGDSVGYIMIYTATTETTVATTVNSADIKPYNRILEGKIPDILQTEILAAYKAANSSYAQNIANIASSSSSTTSHGDRLVVDQSNNTRYTSALSTYKTNLFNQYKQLLYLTPFYAMSTKTSSMVNAPFFNGLIGDSTVIVDKFGNKVSIDQGWSEQIMLSAYNAE